METPIREIGKSRQHLFVQFKDTHRTGWIQRSSHKLVEGGFAPFLYHLRTFKNETSIFSDSIIPGGRDYQKFKTRDSQEAGKRHASYLSLVSSFDQAPDPKYKPHLHRKRHHDRLYVIELIEAQDEGLEFFVTGNGSVFCYKTIKSGVPRQSHRIVSCVMV